MITSVMKAIWAQSSNQPQGILVEPPSVTLLALLVLKCRKTGPRIMVYSVFEGLETFTAVESKL